MAAAMRAVRWADYHNLLPASFIDSDGFFTSAFIANLGSVGMRAGYHHLYEYGNIPFFIVIGRVKKGPVVIDSGELAVHDLVEVRYSFDERITDGFYTSTALERFREYI